MTPLEAKVQRPEGPKPKHFFDEHRANREHLTVFGMIMVRNRIHQHQKRRLEKILLNFLRTIFFLLCPGRAHLL